MHHKKNILLLSDNPSWPFETASLLRVVGYKVTGRKEPCQAIDLCRIHRNTQEHFALLIADVEPSRHQGLEDVYRSGAVDRLLLVQHRFACCELYCLEGQLGHLCQPSAMLACIQELIKTSR